MPLMRTPPGLVLSEGTLRRVLLEPAGLLGVGTLPQWMPAAQAPMGGALPLRATLRRAAPKPVLLEQEALGQATLRRALPG
jgi:hypothetical protein